MVQTVTVLCSPPGVPFAPQPLKRRRELLRVLKRNAARRNRRCLAAGGCGGGATAAAAALALSPRLSRRQAHLLLRRRSIAAMLPHKPEGIIEVPAACGGIPQRRACQPNVEVVVEVFSTHRGSNAGFVRTPGSSERREQTAASEGSSERKKQRAESIQRACGTQGARSRAACGESAGWRPAAWLQRPRRIPWESVSDRSRPESVPCTAEGDTEPATSVLARGNDENQGGRSPRGRGIEASVYARGVQLVGEKRPLARSESTCGISGEPCAGVRSASDADGEREFKLVASV